MANIAVGPVKLQPVFDLQNPNAVTEWKFWKITFQDYLVATGQHEAADQVKLSILRNIKGTDSARTMATLNVPEAHPDR